jgi:hypothetical protein
VVAIDISFNKYLHNLRSKCVSKLYLDDFYQFPLFVHILLLVRNGGIAYS